VTGGCNGGPGVCIGGSAGWVMGSPRFGESSVRMAQRCSAGSGHAASGCGIVMCIPKSSEAD
jgi:hypothetical protein